MSEVDDVENFVDQRLDETDTVPEDELSDDSTFGFHRGYRAALNRIKSEFFSPEEDDTDA